MRPVNYTAYHSAVKIAAFLGTLEKAIAERIPRSTLYRFRHSDYSHLFGLAVDIEESLDLIRSFAQSARAQAVFRAALRVKHTLASMLSARRNVIAVLARSKERVVTLVESVREVLGERRTLRLLGITRCRYTRWKNCVARPCPSSRHSLCLRRHPQQISASEIRMIQMVMTDVRFRGWPVVSIYWRCVRDGLIGFGLSTFYTYVNRLGLTPRCVSSRRRDHTEGIRAARPNEIWHADVTEFRTADHRKAYIFLVVDNYSRRILAWAVDSVKSASTHIRVVKEAWSRFIAPNGEVADGVVVPTLITDGGSENMADSTVPLRHLIAGRDIRFSNSVVEAVNKIIKYSSLYLHRTPFPARVSILGHPTMGFPWMGLGVVVDRAQEESIPNSVLLH